MWEGKEEGRRQEAEVKNGEAGTLGAGVWSLEFGVEKYAASRLPLARLEVRIQESEDRIEGRRFAAGRQETEWWRGDEGLAREGACGIDFERLGSGGRVA
jgi:hypothetical protein